MYSRTVIFLRKCRAFCFMVKRIAIIGGSGLEDLARGEKNERTGVVRFEYYLTKVGDMEVVFVPRHGAEHQNLPLDVPYEDIFRNLKTERVEAILAFSATGTLDHRVPLADQKSFVVPHDFIRGYGYQPVSARIKEHPHPVLSEPFHPKMREAILASGKELGYRMAEKGIYILNEGNGFETKAEIALLNAGLHYPLLVSFLNDVFQKLGSPPEIRSTLELLRFSGINHLDITGAQVGMTAPKEVVLAAEYGIPIGLIACPVNIAEGMSAERLGHDRTMAVISASKPYIKDLAFAVIGKLNDVEF